MRRKFTIPTKAQVPEHNRKIFYSLEQSSGFIPNIYAFMAHSDTALRRFLTFAGASTVYTPVETEAIHLVTSQIDQCQYCLSAHTVLARKAGLTDQQIVDIRKGNVTSDKKLATLVDFTCEVVTTRGGVSAESIDRFYEAGYTDAHLVDLIMLIAQTTATNYINNITRLPLDFPETSVIVCQCDCKK